MTSPSQRKQSPAQRCQQAIALNTPDRYRLCNTYYKNPGCVDPQTQLKLLKRHRYDDARPMCLQDQLEAIVSLLTTSHRTSSGRRIRMALYYVEGNHKFVVCVKTKWYPDYTLPGGKFEGQESPEEAGSRELFEETRRCIRGSSYTRHKPGYPDKSETQIIDLTHPQSVITYDNYEKGFPEQVTFVRINKDLYDHLVPCLLADYQLHPKFKSDDPYTEIVEARSFELETQLVGMMVNGILQIDDPPQRFDDTITFGLFDGLLGSNEVISRIKLLVEEYQKNGDVGQLRNHLETNLVSPMINRLSQQLPVS